MLDALDDPGADEIQDQRQQDLQTELQGLPAELLHRGARIGGQHFFEPTPGHLGRVGRMDQIFC